LVYGAGMVCYGLAVALPLNTLSNVNSFFNSEFERYIDNPIKRKAECADNLVAKIQQYAK